MALLDITVTLPQDQVTGLESLVDADRFAAICRKAVRSGARVMRSRMVSQAAKELGLTKAQVREHAWAQMTKSKEALAYATAGRWGWSLHSLGLDESTFEVEGMGLTAQLPDGRTLQYPHGFRLNEAHGARGGTLTGGFQRAPGAKRYPIRRVFIESPADALRRISADPSIRSAGLDAAMRTLARERDALLTGGKG